MSNQFSDFEVDPSVSSRLKNGINLGNATELPFSAPVFWWSNGSGQNKALATVTPVVYFGGWAVNEDAIDDVKQERGIPAGMAPTEIYTRNNKTIAAYTTRLPVVAPIGYRKSWVIKDMNGGRESRTSEYLKGARQHVQLLAMLGEKQQGGGYLPWGPIALSAKGYQAGHILTALKIWKKTLDPVVRKVAPNLSAWAFYMALGTFGKDPEVDMVGQAGAQSPITPIKLFMPVKIDEGLLKSVFVGKDTLVQMADLLDQAEPWLKAWEQKSPATGSHGEPEFDEDFFPDIDPALSDIPF